ncbi:TetR/AcrR family transcriptional regulator [Falsiroseomonas oryzae]|uniref:TetR/AcrR family transcriptional regulator n=1 Tax=Falsiroseomonas oryzae TaxID=2766473 RepID=UPI0022EABC63|nr:TetR/AcrR family transcriptional regulator [Roseomonas sp. MO-31]
MNDAPATTQPDARTRVLDAAEGIIQARGVAGLTLEAAARDAGVSKGGLLYHFASKEALLDAMLRRLASFMEQQYRMGVEAQPPGPGRVARAMLEWGFGEADPQGETPLHACDERHDRAAAIFLAAFHHDPVLLDPIREVIARFRQDIAADGLPPGVGNAINAASDGMFMARLFRLYTPTPEERAETRAALEKLLEAAR